MNDQELHNLLVKSQQGDQAAFAQIYDYFKERLYRFIYFRVGHKELAEDLLSETFVKAWSKINAVTNPKAFSGWVYQVARNNIIDYYRIKKTTVALEDVPEHLLNIESPVEEVNLSIELAKLLEMLKLLNEEQQEVLQYKFFEDLTNEEIAGIMNKPVGTVRVIQHRAILKLQQILRKKAKL